MEGNDPSADRAAAPADEKLIWSPPSLAARLRYGIAVYSIRYLLFGPLLAFRSFRTSIRPPPSLPDIVKAYECRRHLPIRVFFPKNYDRKSPRPLPLLFTIHGGGFIFGDPTDNDQWNAAFANKHSTLVVALNYAKGPRNHFPGPLSDLEAIISAVFADDGIKAHIDTSKIAVLGWSAGGNLALGISQFPAIRAKLNAVVAIYPVTDFSIAIERKVPTRQFKPSLSGPRAWTKDVLLGIAPLTAWAHLRPEINLRDPLLSPIFAKKEDLPRRVFIVGCELDVLGHEGWQMISQLAGRPVPTLSQKIGQEDTIKPGELITKGDQRFAWEEKNQDGEYKWLLVPDAAHGFDMPLPEVGPDKKTEEDGRAKTEKVIELLGEWLWR